MGGDGIELWMVTLGEEKGRKGWMQRGIFGDWREPKIKISNKLGVKKNLKGK